MGLWGMSYILDAIFLCETATEIHKFRKSTIKGNVSVSPKESSRMKVIAIVVDLLSVVPFELIAAFWFREKWGHMMALLRLNRLLRISKIASYINDWGAQLHTNAMSVHAVKFVVIITIVAHWQTCVWFSLACREDVCVANSWAGNVTASTQGELFPMQSGVQRYITSMYWSIATTTSTGYGDIHPAQSSEKYFAIASMLCGVLIFGYLFGSIASSLANTDAPRARYAEKVVAARKHMADANLADELQSRANDYFDYLWSRKSMTYGPDLVSGEPEGLRAEVALRANERMLRESPIFGGCSEGFLRMISLNIKPALYLPGETVVKRGDLCHMIFFIYRGTLEVRDHFGAIVSTLTHGNHFGEVPTIMRMRAACDIIAITVCDLYTLEKSDMDSILEHYEDMKAKLERDAQERIDQAHLQNPARSFKRSTRKKDGATRHQARHAKDNSIGAPKMETRKHSLIAPSPKKKLQVVKRSAAGSIREGHQLIEAGNPLSSEDNTSVSSASRGCHHVRSIIKTGRKHVFVIIVSLSILSVLMVSFEAAFVSNSNAGIAGGYMVDMVCLVEMGMSIYVAGTSQKAINSKEKFWLMASILANLPVDLLFLAAGSSWETVASTRLNRVLRWFKLHEFFDRKEATSALRSFQSTCIKLAIQIFTMVHIVACAWHALLPNVSAEIASSNLTSSGDLRSSSQKYTYSVYWSVATLTSTGYGDVYATSTAQQVLSIFGMLLGQVLFGTTLATVAATLGNAMKTKNEFRSRLDAIKQFFRDHHVSTGVCQRVELYLEHHWLRYHGHVTAERIQGMPQSLQAELCSAQYETMLDSFPLFRQSTEGFSKHLSFQLRRLLVLPGEHIIHRGDIGKEMYFMNRGVVEVLAQDELSVVTQLSRGTFFGEAGMVFAKPRLNSVRALTHCELLVLSRDHLLQASVHYPAITQIVKRVSENEEHFGAITAAVDLNESIAYDPNIESTRAVNQKTVIRNVCRRKRPKRAHVHPTNADLVEQEQGFVHKDRGKQSTAHPDKNKYCVPECIQGIAECLGIFLMPYTLVPMSRVAACWEVIIMICTIVSSFTILFQAAFLFDSVKLLIFHYFLDFLFMLDMYAKFHTAYTDEHGILVTNQRSTASKYAKTNFWIDALASLPFEIIVAGLTSTTTAAEILRALCLCRINRALRGYRVLLYIKNKEQCITQNTSQLGLLRFVYITFVVTHWSACIWFIIGCFDDKCTEDSWAVSGGVPVIDRAWGHQYLTSVYWTVTTMVSVGYGDIRAHNELEMVYAAFTMLLGTILYGYFIGSIAASIANADYLRSRYKEKLNCLQSFFKRSRVDADVANRVTDHFGYLWARNQGIQAQTLFKDLPLALQADVCMDVYREAISKVPLFRNKGLGFMRLLSLVMQPSLHLKGEYVVRVGDFGQEMYFIQRGSVEVVSADGEEIFASMKDGDFFGEISLVFSCPRTASIRAKTNCDLFVLSKRDLDHVLLSFPEISKQIQLEAKMRFSQVKARKRKASSGHDLNASTVSSRSTQSARSSQSTTICEDEEEKVESSEIFGGICVTVTQDAEMDGGFNQAGMGPLVPFVESSSGSCAENDCSSSDNTNASDAKRELTGVEDGTAKDNGETDVATEEVTQRRCYSDFVSLLLFINRPFRFLLRCFGTGTPVLPHSTSGQVIEIGILLLVLILGFTVTFEAAFFAHGVRFSAFNILSEVLFSIGISFKFHVATIGENGVPQLDYRAIASDYVWHGSFFIDTLTALPLDISFAIFGCRSLKYDRILSALRIVRLFRLTSLTRFFEHHEKKLNTSSVGIRVLKFSIIVTLFTHITACIWYTIACPSDSGCSNSSWVFKQNTTSNQAYADSLYWAMATTTTTGYGDYRAHTDLERAFSIVAMIAGKLMYGFVLGNIASTLANADYLRVCYKEKMAAIDETLIDRSIPDQLRVKVKKYHEYIWKLQNGLDMNALFSDMPYTLRTDVSWNMGEDLLRQVPLFQQGGSGFVAMLALALRPHYFLKGDWIHKEGDICREIMFVSSGYAEVLSKDRVVQIKHPNSYFGEMDCVTGKPYSLSYRAATDIEALVLSQEELFRTLLHFPEMKEVVQRKVGVTLDAKIAYLRRPQN